MAPLYRYSIRNPRRVIAAAVLITAAVAPGVARLRLRTDGNALLPTKAVEIERDRAIREAFGVRDQIAVVIKSDDPDGVFNIHTLELVQEWTTRFGEMENIGPQDVISLATEKSDRVFRGTLRNKGFLDPPRSTRENLFLAIIHQGLEGVYRDALRAERETSAPEGPRPNEKIPDPEIIKQHLKDLEPVLQKALDALEMRELRVAIRNRAAAVVREGLAELNIDVSPAVVGGLYREAVRQGLERLDLRQSRSDLKRIRLFTGTLVSFDDTATAILIGVPGGADRTRLHGRLMEIISERVPIPEQVSVVGAPVAESLLGTHILEDLGVPSALMGHRVVDTRRAQGEAEPWRWPGSFHEFRRLVGRHVGLVPIAVVIMGLVFLVSFRSLAATMLPLGEVGACLIFVLGLMGWCGVPIYLTIAVLPIILTAMGIADEIHIFNRYRQVLRGAGGAHGLDCVTKTMDEIWRPVVKTSITTAIGFMSFVLSPIAPVRAFGVFTAVGIIFCMLWSLTVIPASLSLIGPRRLVGSERGGGGAERLPRVSVLEWVARAVVRFRYLAIIAAVMILAVAPFGVRRVLVQDSWIDGFSADSAFYKATQLVNRLFHGTHILLVCVDAGHEEIAGQVSRGDLGHYQARLPIDPQSDPPVNALVGEWLRIHQPPWPAALVGAAPGYTKRHPRMAQIEVATREEDHILVETNRKDGSLQPSPRLGDDEVFAYDISPRRLLSPRAIKVISDLEDFIEAHRQDAVGGVIGTADYVTTINYMTGGQKESQRSIPEEARKVKWLWRQYDRVRGTHRLREILDPHDARALITVFMENANFLSTRHLMEDIRDYERTHLAPRGMSLEFAGDVAVSQTLIQAIVSTQVRSLLLSLLGILAITSFMGRSLVWGVYCVLPCCLAVLVNFAVMGLTGMPLGVATSMFSAMTLGIGVDFAIHFTERFRHVAGLGLPPAEAVVDAVKTVGPAVVLDALAIALGFGIMILSQVPSNARLGGLVVLSVATCLSATLLLLPALLALWRPTVGPGR